MTLRKMLAVVVLLVPMAVGAREVEQAVAVRYAEARMGREAVLVQRYGPMYVVQFADGWLLMADDDRLPPVLAYGLRGQFSVEGMPPQVEGWLRGYVRQVEELKKHLPASSADPRWSRPVAPAAKGSAVGPLLATTWGQWNGYAQLTPAYGPYREHCPTGCTATAMAQVMKYWNHPQRGYGSHSYHDYEYQWGELAADFGQTEYRWDLMPAAVPATAPEEEQLAVSTLIYHCGVAIGTHYTPDASYADINGGDGMVRSAEMALRTYFRYSSQATTIQAWTMSDAEYKGLLRGELGAGRPVLYVGGDANVMEHAFVCDGYDDEGYFHFNFGWGGRDDGWFLPGSICPGSGYDFTPWQFATIRIFPVYTDEGAPVTVSAVCDPARGSVSGSGTYTAFRDTVTLVATPNEGYEFVRWSSGSRRPRRVFIANEDRADTAIFTSPAGITPTGPQPLRVAVRGRTVAVRNASAAIGVYDMEGRRAGEAVPRGGEAVWTAPCAGIYLLHAADGGTARVVLP